jgi:hypothetical protein
LVAYFSGLAVLSWQYYFKFADPASPMYQSSITLTAPFEVWSYYSDYIALKFVLSSLFPLYVAIIFWRSTASDVLSKYAWILYIIGLAYTGFLAESAANSAIKYAGNFIWSGQIANFLLFVSTAKLFFSKTSFCPWQVNKKMLFGLLIFMLHAIAGLIYYIRSFSFNYT